MTDYPKKYGSSIMIDGATTLAKPQTLDAVKKGDTVWVFPGVGGYCQSKVIRVTKHQIVLEGDDHYHRSTGMIETDGYGWGRRTVIAVGAEATTLKAERHAEKLRYRAAHELGIHNDDLNQDTVTAKRAACDRAESTLRELGEWKDA
jgi:hypothetical protein